MMGRFGNKVDKAIFLISEGIKNLWRHKLTAFAAIFSVFLSLLLVGVLLIAGQNTNKIIEYFRSKYKIEVFFKDSVSEKKARFLLKEIRSIPGVRSTTLITKNDAMRIFKSQVGEDILELVGYNPLPLSCVVNVVKKRQGQLKVDPIIDKIKAYKEVDDVKFLGSLIYRIERMFQKFLKLTVILSVAVVIITVIIISNTLRLTIYSKKDLIEALQLVGATRSFIKTPFIFEGVLQGLIGAIMAAGVLTGGLYFGNRFIASIVSFEIQYNPISLLLWLSGIAVFIGFLGSSRATSRFLK